jgi:flagellar biosynthesis/type III secretory pathway M-ring protein FliF/YscJ
MSNIHDITLQLAERSRRVRGPVDNGGGPPDDPRMEERVKKLEGLVEKTVERIVNIERDVAVVRSNYATKEDLRGVAVDLHKELNAQTWKLVTFVCGFGTALVAATYFIAINVPSKAPAPLAPAATSSLPAK